jgi:hypothetical protein
MPPPPAASYTRLHAFIAGINASVIKKWRLNTHTHILFTDPFAASSYIKFNPSTHRLEAKGISMVHFDKLRDLFDAMKGGIEVTELILEDCTIRGSLFFWIVNENTHNLILKNVRVFEGNVFIAPGQQPSPRTPAWWEDILPVFIYQARLRYCHLEGLEDFSSSLSIDKSGLPTFHSESSMSIKKGLKELYWNLCWESWCSDPVEYTQTEIYYYWKSRPRPRPDCTPVKCGETETAA